MARQKVELKEGMRLLIWDEDLEENNNQDNIIVEAIAKYNHKLKIWQAVVESEKVGHESDLKK